jgi:hypothetical protein
MYSVQGLYISRDSLRFSDPDKYPSRVPPSPRRIVAARRIRRARLAESDHTVYLQFAVDVKHTKTNDFARLL